MRRSRRDRGKPIPRSDLDKIATFRTELQVFGKLLDEGVPRREAMRTVWQDNDSAVDAHKVKPR